MFQKYLIRRTKKRLDTNRPYVLVKMRVYVPVHMPVHFHFTIINAHVLINTMVLELGLLYDLNIWPMCMTG